MNNIVRAWKDEAYRQNLSAEEQAMLPANPAGEIELTDTELEAISGATSQGVSGQAFEGNAPQNTTQKDGQNSSSARGGLLELLGVDAAVGITCPNISVLSGDSILNNNDIL